MKKIERDIDAIYTSLGRMTALVDESLENAIIALKHRNSSLEEKAARLDEQINAMEIKINHDCIVFIASNQPVASDLRVIASVHKIITDLERIGDIAKDICHYVSYIENTTINQIDDKLLNMANDAKKMVGAAIRSFTNSDLKDAKEVIEFDNVIDEQYRSIRNNVVVTMDNVIEGTNLSLLLYQTLIAKYLEKIGDHAQNIAEWIIFNVSGSYKI